MKPGLVHGRFEELTILVTPEMSPHFEGRLIHPVYSTWWLVHHMELAGRRVLAPHLEEHEEAVGGGIRIEHCGPALIGTPVRVRATVESCEKGRLDCRVTAHAAERPLALGIFTQVIMPRAKLAALLHRAASEVQERELLPAEFQYLLETPPP